MGKEADYKFWLSLSDIEVDGNLIWFVPREINAIFTLNIQTGKVEFKHVLDLYKIYHTVGYMRIKKFGDRLFILPFASADGVKVYDIKNNKVNTIKIRESSEFSKQYRTKKWGFIRHFLECEIFEGKLYLLGIDYPAIVELDMQTYECKYYDSYMKTIFNKGDVTGINYLYYFERRGDSLLCPVSNCNVIVEFNMKNKSFSYHRVGADGSKYCYILGYKNNYWLLSALPHKGVTTWNYKDNTICVSENYPVECDYSKCLDGTSGYYIPVWSRKNIIHFPDSVNMAVEYDTKTGIIGRYKKLDWLFYENVLYGRWFTSIRQIEGFTYAYINYSHQLLIFEKNMNLVKRHMPYLDYEEKRKLVNAIRGYAVCIGPYVTGIRHECDEMDVELFISYSGNDNGMGSYKDDVMSVGRAIYEEIIKRK